MQTPSQADISPRTETKLVFLGSLSLASSRCKATPRSKERDCRASSERSRPLHGSTRQTLLYFGVRSLPPRLQDSQPDLRKRAGKREYPAWRELSGSQATLTPQSLAHHLPGIASFHLFQKPPQTDGFKAPPAPPQSASLSTQDSGRLRPAGRCHPWHSPVPPSEPVSTRLTRRRCPPRDPTGHLTPLFIPCFSKSTVPSLNTPTGTPGPSVRLS